MTHAFHAFFPGALCERIEAVGPDAVLAAYRLEPVRTVDGGRCALDLTFAAGDEAAVVAGIFIDPTALAARDRSPYVLPRDAAPAGARIGAALDAIDGELRAAFTTHGEPAATLRVLDARDLMHARRSARALGAVPYAQHARARGADVGDDAYLETIFGGDVPPPAPAEPVTAGAPHAPFRCYVAVSDEALACGGAAYRAALSVAAALAGDDVAVDVAGYDGRPLDAYAFVHAVGLEDPHAAGDLIAAAHARGVRAFLTPLFDDAVTGGFWGARAHVRTLHAARTEDVAALHLGVLAARNLQIEEDVAPDTPLEPRPGFRAAERRALASADAVFVTAAAEAARIRVLLGADRAFTAFVPAVLADRVPDPHAEHYVLAVAPVGPLHASATIARAAARAGLPVRFSGAVVDGGYAARARSYLDGRSRFAPGDPGAGARVVVDASWSGVDLGTLADHAAYGVPVVSSARADAEAVFGTRGVRSVDPADEAALAAALTDAWNGGSAHAEALAAHVRARCRLDVLRACLGGVYRAAAVVA